MGKHLWVRNLGDESRDKQPGCMWGLVHVLDYHHWQSNVKKMIHHRKYEGRTHDKRMHLFEALVSLRTCWFCLPFPYKRERHVLCIPCSSPFCLMYGVDRKLEPRHECGWR